MNPFTFTTSTDKMPGAWHGAYLDAYALLFAGIKDSPHSIAEIGVDGGGSLLMYRNHFPSSKAVVGMDLSPRPGSLHPDIQFRQGDAYSPEGVAYLQSFGPFALIVDDGSHQLGHQEYFVRHYPQLLAPDGIAIVEDIASWEHIPILGRLVPEGFTSFGIDLRHTQPERFDNAVLVICRK